MTRKAVRVAQGGYLIRLSGPQRGAALAIEGGVFAPLGFTIGVHPGGYLLRPGGEGPVRVNGRLVGAEQDLEHGDVIGSGTHSFLFAWERQSPAPSLMTESTLLMFADTKELKRFVGLQQGKKRSGTARREAAKEEDALFEDLLERSGRMDPQVLEDTKRMARREATTRTMPRLGEALAAAGYVKRSAPPEPPEELPRRFGPFVLLRRVGRGGSGTVYEALDEKRMELLALKIFRVPADDRIERDRVRREMGMLDEVTHAALVRYWGAGLVGDQPFLAMEFVDGTTLGEAVGRCHLGLRDAIAALSSVCEGVEALHAGGVVHRDIKPGNILLRRSGGAVLTDLGLAISPEDPATVNDDLVIIGTPAYMSPEQARGMMDRIGRWSDVYALGATLYFVLTGRPPFVGKSPQATLERVLAEEPAPPESFWTVSPTVREERRMRGSEAEAATRRLFAAAAAVARRAMAKEPRERIAGARAMAQELAAALAAARTPAVRSKRPSRIGRR